MCVARLFYKTAASFHIFTRNIGFFPIFIVFIIYLFFIYIYYILIIYIIWKYPISPHFYQHLLLSVLFIRANVVRVKCYIATLLCISLIVNDV